MARCRLPGADRVRMLLLLLVAAALAACSSSAPAEIVSAPPVTENGKHYTYDEGSVARSSWPKVCTLLTTDAAAAALGAAVVTKSFHQRCFYVPGNDSFPTLTVTILGIGNDQRDTFDEVRDNNARFKPVRVADVGRSAVLYNVSGSPTVNLDVLAGQGVFEVALRSPVGNTVGATQAQDTLVRVATVLAGEFSG